MNTNRGTQQKIISLPNNSLRARRINGAVEDSD